MKQSAFLLKSFLVVTMMGWTLMSNAQRYEIEHGRVYFGDEVMMQADARSFVDLGCGYAKDRMNDFLCKVMDFFELPKPEFKAFSQWEKDRDKFLGIVNSIKYNGQHFGKRF